MSKTLKQIIREAIKQELEETSTSGNAGGFQTPFAFRGNSAGGREKQRKNANQAGYRMIPGAEEPADEAEPQKKSHQPVKFGEAYDPDEEAAKKRDADPKTAMKNRAEQGGADLFDKTIESDAKKADSPTAKKAHEPVKFGEGPSTEKKIFGVKKSDKPSVKTAHTPVPMGEGVSKYEQYRADESVSPQRKIGMAISEINKQLKTIDEALKLNAQLKKEHNLGSTNLWKRTTRHLTTMEGKLLRIAHRIQELKS